MKKKYGKLLIEIVLILIGLTFLYPLIWMILMSLKSTSEIYDNQFGLPRVLVLANYPNALETLDFLRLFLNSVLYCAGTITVTILLSGMFAYSTSRMNWKYGRVAMSYVALGLIIPVQVVIIPIFMLLKDLQLRNTYFGLILPYAAFALASATLMLYAFLRTLPRELEESSCLDGCNVYKAFALIILPIVRPAIVTQVVVIFMNTWNEFFMAFILVTEKNMKTLPIGLMNFFMNIGTTQWGQIGAAMVISSIPTILVYLFFSEQIENALTAGAILK